MYKWQYTRDIQIFKIIKSNILLSTILLYWNIFYYSNAHNCILYVLRLNILSVFTTWSRYTEKGTYSKVKNNDKQIKYVYNKRRT